jgi:ribosome-binding factor A
LRGLEHATGFLQARVAARLQTRFTPVLSFKYDDSVRKSVEISRLIDQAVASDRPRASESPETKAALEEETAAVRPGDKESIEEALPEGS